jgi:hypothetical protein
MNNDTGRRNHISHDNPNRGYTTRHSTYDSPFNMDFEYGYLSMMTNFSTFVSRTQDMYSQFEEGFSELLETQRERRLRSYTLRQRNIREALLSSNEEEVEVGHGREQEDGGDQGETQNSSNNTNNASNANNNTQRQRNRSANTNTNTNRLFDMGDMIYSIIPRTVIIDPNNTGLRSSSQNRGINGLTIHQVEEHTEIINYGSIPTNDILNTECPISISPFTSDSVVLRLKRCKHCFVPFRMMAWMETHSTCPLCRVSIVETEPVDNTNPSENVEQPTSTNNSDFTELLNNIRNNIVNGLNNTTSAPTPAPVTSEQAHSNGSDNRANNINNILNQLPNLSVDNVNNDSIVFSFDMPRNSDTYDSRLNDLNELSNSYIIPQLSQLFSNTLSRGLSRSATTPPNNTNNQSDNQNDNSNMDLD